MTIKEKYTVIKDMINSLEEDVDKFGKGNRAAGTRIRVGLQEAKKRSQELRVHILEETKKH